MSAPANADRALRALTAGTFSHELRDALSSLSPDDRSDALENNLLRALAVSSYRKFRSASALALADLNSEVAPQVVRGLLTSPETRGSRATLLYALRGMKGRLSLALLVGMSANDTEETREELLNFLEQDLVEAFPEAEELNAIRYLEALLTKEKSASKQAILRDTIDLLSALAVRCVLPTLGSPTWLRLLPELTQEAPRGQASTFWKCGAASFPDATSWIGGLKRAARNFGLFSGLGRNIVITFLA